MLGLMPRMEIDGVTVLVEPRPGEAQADLTFGVGGQDEDVDTAGLSQYVLELILDRMAGRPIEAEGITSRRTTNLYANGEPDAVFAQLTAFCEAITELFPRRYVELDPLNRDLEFWIEPALLDPWASLRARLTGEPERWPVVGPEAFTDDEVNRHVVRHFTTGNAVLVLSCPPPPDLRLPLPAGGRSVHSRQFPAPPSAATWYADAVLGTGLAFWANADHAEAVATSVVLADRAQDALKRSGSALIVGRYQVLTTDGRTLIGLALRMPKRSRAVSVARSASAAALLWRELGRLASEPPSLEELAGHHRRMVDELAALRGKISKLVPGAWDQLGDAEWAGEQDAEEVLFDRADPVDVVAVLPGLSTATVARIAADAVRRATIVVPQGARPELAGMAEGGCPRYTVVPAGQELRPSWPRRLWTKQRLILASDALTDIDAEGRTHTIPFADLLIVDTERHTYIAHCGHGCVTDVTAFARALAPLRDRLPARRWRFAT